MKHVIRVFLFFSLLATGLTSKAQTASYIVAADLTYANNGNHSYTFTLELYSECGSPFGNLSNVGNFPLAISSPSLGEELSPVIMTKTGNPAGEEVKIFCDDEPTNCSTPDGFRGLTRYTYEGIVNLSSATPAPDWIISWRSTARTFELNSTLDNAEIEQYYVDALINTQDFTGNNSPVFNSGEKGPIVRVCIGEEETYSLLATDPDADELTYSLATPLSDSDLEVVYQTGFSAQNPVSLSSSLSVSDDGNIAINATTADQIGITDVIVEEYENGILKGRIRRGIQINTFNCDNDKPIIGSFNNGSDTLSLCVGSEMEFGDVFIWGKDPDEGDEVKFQNVESVIELPDGTPASASVLSRFIELGSSDSTSLVIFWEPSSFDVGTYQVTVTLEDNACPTSRTETKEFIINIVPEPEFDLNESFIFQCDSAFTLESNATIGAEPATYIWTTFSELGNLNGDTIIVPGDTISNDPNIDIDEPINLALTIVDAAGCSSTDTVQYLNGLLAEWEFQEFCVGDTTEFISTSTSQNGDIVRYEWIVQDPGLPDSTITGVDSTGYAHTGAGEFDVLMIIEDEASCIDSVLQTITLCEHLTQDQMDIFWADSCRRNNGEPFGEPVIFTDLTQFEAGCGAYRRFWWVEDVDDGIPQNEQEYCDNDEIPCQNPADIRHPHEFTDSGYYDVFLEITQSSGCVDTIVERIFIQPRQEFETDAEQIYINCNEPDTLITLTLDTTWTGYGPYEYTWSTIADPFNQTPIDDPNNLQHTLSSTDTYIFWVTDLTTDCQYGQTVSVEFPFTGAISFDTVCADSLPLEFSSTLVLADTNRSIETFVWHFGDGNTSSEENPVHQYDAQGLYEVTLEIADSTGCTIPLEGQIPYLFPEDRFEVVPSLLEASICVGSPVQLNTVFWPHTVSSSTLDTVFWNFGDGDTSIYVNASPQSADQGSSVTHTYTDTTTINITNYVIYNGVCRIEHEFDLPTEVQPQIDGEIDFIHSCLGDSLEVEFIRTVNEEIGLESALWAITRFGTFDSVVTSTDLEPTILVQPGLFFSGGSYNINLTLRDVNGCVFSTITNMLVEDLPQVSLNSSIVCPGEPFEVQILLPEDSIYQNRDGGSNYLVDLVTLDTLLFSQPNSTEYEDPETGVMTSGDVVFNTGGAHPVRAYFTDISENECRSVLDDTLYSHELPILDFEASLVCADYVGDPTQFTNLTDTNNTVITRYHWDFGDGDTSNLENPSHVFAVGGAQTVTLTAYTEEGCAGSISKQVAVTPSPQANFYTEEDILEAEVPIQFRDSTITLPDEGEFVVDQFWDFGDGTTSDELEPEHTYDDIEIYTVTYAVENNFGCVDTIVKVLDLNTYLDLPTAFSPNLDGTNDGLFLIHKSIRELYEYKIYNRYGELVFETSDLNTGWDGTFRGQDQEIGVYVAHVKALGAYDTQHNFKKNVTLLR